MTIVRWLSLLLLAACAPAAVEDLRSDHAAKRRVEVHDSYQNVYRTVLSQARRCWQSTALIVQGDLFTDTKSGTVQVSGEFGVYLAVDVAPLDDKRSSVLVYNAFSTWEDHAATVVEWLRDGSRECATRPKS